MFALSKNSIGLRLLRYVFGCYFIVALIVTITQLFSEYQHTKKSTFLELSNIGETIEKNVSYSLWNYELEQLNAIINGIDKIEIVSGTRVTSPEGEELAGSLDISSRIISTENKQHGRFGNGEVTEFSLHQNGRKKTIFQYKEPVNYSNEEQDLNELIGYTYFYTTHAIIIDKVKYSFLLIVVNSLVKTLALWFLFLYFTEKIVAKPLRVLTTATKNTDPGNMDPENPELHHQRNLINVITHNGNVDDEIQILIRSFNKMQRSVQENTHKIQTQNSTLEERVRSRTEAIEKINKKLIHLSLHDPLTGLPNRILFDDRLDEILLKSQDKSLQFSVASIDLKKFKNINDTLGHQAGDAVLCEIASRMQNVIGTGDTIARMGGDEFALILPGADRQAAIAVGKKLIDCTLAPVVLENKTIHSSINIGFSVYPEDGSTSRVLYKNADIAMYQAKRHEHGLAVFTLDIQKDQERQEIIAEDLLNFDFLNQLVLQYQPIISGGTHKIKGLEALVRWNHPQYGIISPDEFIPITERSNAINKLTYWVAKQAFKDLLTLHEVNPELSISINVSGCLINDTSFPETMIALVDDSKIDPQRIILEITESNAMSNPDQTLDVLVRLKQYGIKLSIDDFGTGYSSFSYLTRLPVDELKIDRSFLLDVDHNSNLVVQSIVEVAHRLNLKVVAEGVENDIALGFLESLNCDFLQGYYFSPPLSADNLLPWILQYSQTRVAHELPRKFG